MIHRDDHYENLCLIASRYLIKPASTIRHFLYFHFPNLPPLINHNVV